MEMHPATLRFDDAEAEASFRTAHVAQGIPRAQGIIRVFCAVLLLSMGVDYAAVPELWHYSLLFKAGIATPALLLLAKALPRPWFAARFHAVVLVASLALGAGVLFPMYLVAPLHLAQSFLWGWLVAAVASSLCVGLRLPYALAALGCYLVFMVVTGVVLEVPAQEGWALAGFTGVLVALVVYGVYQLEHAERRAWMANQASERLLLNVLPEPVAARLKDAPGAIAERFAGVTVLFADIVGFTTLSARLGPEQLVSRLDDVFSSFDDLADSHGMEKIKTIGDCYMAAAGLPEPCADHVQRAADLALDLRSAAAVLGAVFDDTLQLRIGLATGPVVAGVIGKRKFIYDMWGDTVNRASRMESHGAPGTIQITAAVRAALGDAYVCEDRGEIDVKGLGPTRVWELIGPAV